MKPKRDFLYALDQVRTVIVRLHPADMDLPTPNTEWNVRELLQHVLYKLLWAPDIILGQTIEQVGRRYEGDNLGSNPIAAWRSAAVQASEAIRRCDPNAIAHVSYGDILVREYLEEATLDRLVHAWDLGQAVGIPVRFDEAIVTDMYRRTLARGSELYDSGLFAAPVDVSATATTQTKLLALLGRSQKWRVVA